MCLQFRSSENALDYHGGEDNQDYAEHARHTSAIGRSGDGCKGGVKTWGQSDCDIHKYRSIDKSSYNSYS